MPVVYKRWKVLNKAFTMNYTRPHVAENVMLFGVWSKDHLDDRGNRIPQFSYDYYISANKYSRGYFYPPTASGRHRAYPEHFQNLVLEPWTPPARKKRTLTKKQS